MKRRYLTLVLLLMCSVLPQLLFAAPSLTVAPLVIDVTALPRDILTREITLTNTGSQPVTVYPTVNNISLNEGGTIEEFLPPVESDRTRSLASWIEISRRGIDLPKGESKTVILTLRINPTPVPGEYHAYIGFGFGRNQTEAEQMVRMGRAPGSVVTVTIEDERNELLKLSRFIIDRFVTEGGNQAATYKIQNPGDEPLTPSGEIIFYNNRGAEVGMMIVNPDKETIPPGAEKEFNTEVPVDGLFGKYKAFLTVQYGSQLASVQDTAFFYVFPIKVVLMILGVVCVIAVVMALFVHRRYLGETVVDDSELLPFHIRDTRSDAQEHDINLKEE